MCLILMTSCTLSLQIYCLFNLVVVISHRLCVRWANLRWRFDSGWTLRAFYRVVSAVTPRPAGGSAAHQVISVTPSSRPVWRSTRRGFHQPAPVHMALAAHLSWVATPTPYITMEMREVTAEMDGLLSHLNMHGQWVQLIYQFSKHRWGENRDHVLSKPNIAEDTWMMCRFFWSFIQTIVRVWTYQGDIFLKGSCHVTIKLSQLQRHHLCCPYHASSWRWTMSFTKIEK